jgi:hypothetical protein
MAKIQTNSIHEWLCGQFHISDKSKGIRGQCHKQSIFNEY